jgi:hypothetical protein
MRLLFLAATCLGGLLACTAAARAQQVPVPPQTGPAETGPAAQPGLLPPLEMGQLPGANASGSILAQLTPPTLFPASAEQADSLDTIQKLQAQLTAAQAAQKDGKNPDLQKRIELLQKQIEVQQQMLKLLFDHVKGQPMAGSVSEKMQEQLAVLDARSKQSAQRDQELANGLDNLTDYLDTLRREVVLPGPLRELFIPSGTNETPLSIYGALAFGYTHILGNAGTAMNGAGRPATPGGFYFGEFTPDFLLKLNDWIFLEAEIGIGSDGSVSAGSFAQADFFVNDWLTIVAGRFVAPIGWFNDRLNNPWINKLPGDAPGSGPLLWQQVLPAMSLLGVMAQGAFYLFNSPLKMEYHAYVSNGLNLTPATAGAPALSELANLENMTSTFNIITNDKIAGGRLGLWWAEMGLAGGLSGLYNGDYIAGGFEDSMSLWAADLNYHKGNWDAHIEYGATFQQAKPFLANNIRRKGFYAQVAYRPWDLPPGPLQQTELVYRYTYVDFTGIDPTGLDLTTFSTPIDVPIRRQQNEFGVNYYFYPRMVLKFAYQLNDEPNHHLHDNQFLTELAWGW